MNNDLIEYKQYPSVKDTSLPKESLDNITRVRKELFDKIVRLRKDPAIIHYRDAHIEWWAEFDEDDNEVHFRCSNGFERWRTWRFDADKNKFVIESYRDNEGNYHN